MKKLRIPLLGLCIFIFLVIFIYHSKNNENSNLQATDRMIDDSTNNNTNINFDDSINHLVYKKYDGEVIDIEEDNATITITYLDTENADNAVVILINSNNGEKLEKEYSAGMSFDNINAGTYIVIAYEIIDNTYAQVSPYIDISYNIG